MILLSRDKIRLETKFIWVFIFPPSWPMTVGSEVYVFVRFALICRISARRHSIYSTNQSG